MENSWKKIEASPAWNKSNPDGTYSLKEGDELVGIYKGKEEGIGDNNSTLYNFKTAEGLIGVWETTVLAARLKSVEEGEEVKIVYLGTVKSKTKGRKPYHNFDVFHRKSDFIPVVDDSEAKSFDEQINQ